MIVVGGWSGRQVIGLNGRFGVRQSELASGGAEPSPFLNNFDPVDDALTEMVVVVTSLPASGTVTLTDDGDFTHTGAADGAYTTLGTVYSWAPGGPLVVHAEPESISSTFGTSTAVALEAACSASISASAALSTGVGLASSALGTSVASADLQLASQLVTTGVCRGAAAAAISGAIVLIVAGSTAATVRSSAELTSVQPGAMQAAARAMVQAGASMSTQVSLADTAVLGTASATAVLTTGLQLETSAVLRPRGGASLAELTDLPMQAGASVGSSAVATLTAHVQMAAGGGLNCRGLADLTASMGFVRVPAGRCLAIRGESRRLLVH
ncbi:MAG: hypothetical protein C0423_19860 [Methylibium sp.]|nr:hypothetical protein [Methylibium sp.]